MIKQEDWRLTPLLVREINNQTHTCCNIVGCSCTNVQNLLAPICQSQDVPSFNASRIVQTCNNGQYCCATKIVSCNCRQVCNYEIGYHYYYCRKKCETCSVCVNKVTHQSCDRSCSNFCQSLTVILTYSLVLSNQAIVTKQINRTHQCGPLGSDHEIELCLLHFSQLYDQQPVIYLAYDPANPNYQELNQKALTTLESFTPDLNMPREVLVGTIVAIILMSLTHLAVFYHFIQVARISKSFKQISTIKANIQSVIETAP